ncbi:MAG: biopolymer transporter ExbD [Brevinematales bacterium]|nr:biopolymer transporter ExbD [Brevinematales bacterium]
MKVKGKRAVVEIPTASQSDIAFLLIIFFLITASFAVKTGVPLAYPKKQSLPKEVYKRDIATLHIGKHILTLGGKPVTTETLPDALALLSQRYLVVEVEKGLTYKEVVQVLSLLQESNKEISLRVVP